MDLQMVGEGQGALMGSGWILKGKKDFIKNNSYYY